MWYQAEFERRDDLERRYPDQFMKLWLFDIIIGNTDRHDGNFLLRGEQIFAIDHGYSMSYREETYGKTDEYFQYKKFGEYKDRDIGYFGRRSPYKDLFDKNLSPEIVAKLKKFRESAETKQILRQLLAELIGDKAADVCISRIEKLAEIAERLGKIPHDYKE